MGNDPKCRIAIEIDGQPRELMSIVERKASGDLLIANRHPTNHRHPDGQDDVIETDRVSVHYSKNSTGTTIKQTYSLASGIRYSNAAFIRQSKTDLLWVIKATLQPDMRHPRYALAARPRDTVVDIGWYNPAVQCVAYVLVVAAPEIEILAHEGFNLRILRFSRFTLGLFWTFFPGGPMPHAETAFSATSAPRVNEGPVDRSIAPAGSASLTQAQLTMVLYDLAKNLSARLRAEIARHLSQDQSRQIGQLPHVLQPTPHRTAEEMKRGTSDALLIYPAGGMALRHMNL